MRRHVLSILLLALLVIAGPQAGLSYAQSGLCSSTAKVGWEVDYTSVTVTGVHVRVEGCTDGAFVGIELLTEDGEVPADGPLPVAVVDEVAIFDVSGFQLGIEPITAIRVYLEREGELVPVVTTIIEQRFFNPAGNEQTGLRRTTELVVPLQGLYAVPGAPARYRAVDCDEVNLQLDARTSQIIGWGSGPSSTATMAGRHIVCYQQVAGPPGGAPGGPPDSHQGGATDSDARTDGSDEFPKSSTSARSDAEKTEVRGVTIKREDAEHSGIEGDDEQATEVLGQTLARTGVAVTGLVGAGLGLVGGGVVLIRRRQQW